jgi:hypothetical protein
MVLTVSFVIFPVIGLCCHRRLRILPADLTPASRRQNHTTSPSASRAVRPQHISVHRIPPRVRDDREPPPQWDGTARLVKVIWVGGEAEYFSTGDWTGQISLNQFNKSG